MENNPLFLFPSAATARHPPVLHLPERPDAEHLQRPPAIPFRFPPASATTVSTSGYRLAERAKSGEYSFCRPWGRRRYLCDVQKTAAPLENGRPLFRSSGFRRCCCFLSHYVPLRLTQSRKACLQKDVSPDNSAPHRETNPTTACLQDTKKV